MVLSLLFSRRNSIFHIRFFFRLLYLTLVNLKYSSVGLYCKELIRYMILFNLLDNILQC